MCLDRWRGYPFIPGSAIKGVSRHAAWQEWRETQNPGLAQRIAQVFGYPTQQGDLDRAIKEACPDIPEALSGAISFLAAIPLCSKTNNVKIDKDICTSHHPNYYQGGQEPFDNENPFPLVFPVVCSGVDFLFQIMPLPLATETVRQDARRWLLKAICEYGIGAKTAAGYGWFSFDEQTSEQALLVLAEELRERQLAKEEREQQRRNREAQRLAEETAAKQRKEREERHATMTPEQILDEKIEKMTPEQFLTRLGQFPLAGGRNAIPPEEKAALLRALKGPRNDVWQKIKSLRRGRNTPNWPRIVNDISSLHRQLYNGERMP